MKSVNAIVRAILLVSAFIGLLPSASAAVVIQDVVTVGTVSGSQVVDVPVYIRDVSGTPLGIDQPPGSRIQAYSIKVNYSPASAVQAISFHRAGITAGLTPLFETSPSAPGSIALLDTFSEATNLIPFTLNAPAPGDQVAHLTVTITPNTAPGTVINLTLDPVLTQLTDEGGNPGTAESSGNGRLALVNGSINVLAVTIVPTLSQWALIFLAISLAVVAIRIRM
jgi:hypothetical protein